MCMRAIERGEEGKRGGRSRDHCNDFGQEHDTQGGSMQRLIPLLRYLAQHHDGYDDAIKAFSVPSRTITVVLIQACFLASAYLGYGLRQ